MKNSKFKFSKILFFLFFLSLIFYLLSNIHRHFGKKITVGNSKVRVEIAKTEAQREQGLSDRKSLCPDCGLLFIFDESGIYPFWMRRMYFDIDILWIREGRVMDITYGAKVPPKEEIEAPKTFYQSREPIDSVLEVNAGWTRKNRVKAGDRASF